ncbi:uncharacterized protein BO97DRAFT_406085 [Aspergillus homomorphus CBS 101889]|uniref:Uncharacterized protein n=1 Tax=Aspergillus homomorphus (strain CBS 101889) TaxID=1450537 RepID=A0A395HUX9_ASPHC|nr:hypothetical protein BO97DRAFT_406085 [Aspergillus homomorphus CBS 101889]RAL11742.1 hypothetical protein BO97DRAFT_406085 [Aspergillus homomorphus CBS 101889]
MTPATDRTCPVRSDLNTVDVLRQHQKALQHKLSCTNGTKKFVRAYALNQHSHVVHKPTEGPPAALEVAMTSLALAPPLPFPSHNNLRHLL